MDKESRPGLPQVRSLEPEPVEDTPASTTAPGTMSHWPNHWALGGSLGAFEEDPRYQLR